MKTKIESGQLESLGATPRQIEAYNETDPLTIYYDTESEKYSMVGAIECADMSAQDLLDFLGEMRDSWDDE